MIPLVLALLLSAPPDKGVRCGEGLMEPLARAHLAAKRGGANDWLTLQKEADKLADQLTKRKMKPKEALALQDQLLDCLSVIGVRLLYCEAGLDWEAGSEGFAHYLAAMPNGLHADEAYWNTRVEPRGCGDFEPFVEAYLEGIQRYETFLRLFPSSRLRPRAVEELGLYRAGLAEELARERSDGGS